MRGRTQQAPSGRRCLPSRARTFWSERGGRRGSGGGGGVEGGGRGGVGGGGDGVLSGPAIQRIEEWPLEAVVVTNSIAPSEEARACKKIKVISIGRILGEAIRRIHNS